MSANVAVMVSQYVTKINATLIIFPNNNVRNVKEDIKSRQSTIENRQWKIENRKLGEGNVALPSKHKSVSSTK